MNDRISSEVPIQPATVSVFRLSATQVARGVDATSEVGDKQVGLRLCHTRLGFELNSWSEGMMENAIHMRSWTCASAELFLGFFE